MNCLCKNLSITLNCTRGRGDRKADRKFVQKVEVHLSWRERDEGNWKSAEHRLTFGERVVC